MTDNDLQAFMDCVGSSKRRCHLSATSCPDTDRIRSRLPDRLASWIAADKTLPLPMLQIPEPPP